MELKCPGSSSILRPTIELIPCPRCGGEVEIFTDEQKAGCENCGATVFREASPSCIEWCSCAEKCIGEEKYKRIIGDKNRCERGWGEKKAV
jgi:NADH pyrophosphatase NudC (nudix superfamily)